MAVYVISDLHGLELSRLLQLLKRADFCYDDWLYILGDVIDRQNDGGIEILNWLLTCTNAQLILGNHEAMLLACEFLFEKITEESIDRLDTFKTEALNAYLENGGKVTLNALRHQNSQKVNEIFEYLKNAPLYETVSVADREFILCHSGLGNFSSDKKLSDYTAEELLWIRPDYYDSYYPDVTTVFGHTPTIYYGREFKGHILRRPTWIDIDVGVPYGNAPVLLRLDDLEEFTDTL